ncbi:exonuclease 1-like isoform X1 [Papaver somniferum]|uniref:exonuclease 1-like isoform X1 n=1 Tax=Papaver somniferum TaxID=3469 RepID=UPI000E6FC717|nr:exonuclease 1-like isoform X1 [Papaver somniferum]
MGITGLLPRLKSIMVPIHIKDLRGCSVAVDTYSWLHKGALSCSKELCKSEPTSRHIAYCMHRVNLLRHYGVKPILVFDGGNLPMKCEEEAKRSRSRKENLERAMEHESMGNSAAAYECYQKAVDISPAIANELIQVLKQENIDFVVAPYEADAQMAFLALSKQVDAVITEDSDLIPFGCPRIIFKMDKFGQGVQYQSSLLQKSKELNLSGFTQQMVLEMCILSGCDYLPSLPGMGLMKAHALICKFKSYEKVIKHLKYSTVAVPPLYEKSFKKALWTFQHQRVYDPRVEDIVHLSEICQDLGEDLEFLGPMLPQDTAKGIARGDLDAITKMPFQGIALNGLAVDRNYKPKGSKSERERKKVQLPIQKNVLTNYFCSASAEAKRGFKVPRIISTNLGLSEESTSPSSEENASQEPTSLSMNSSQSDIFGSSSPKDYLEVTFPTETAQFLDSPCYSKTPLTIPAELNIINNSSDSSEHSLSFHQPKQSLYRPCTMLHKELQCKIDLDQAGEKTRQASRKVIVRSSYFQHKSPKDDAVDNGKPVFLDDEANYVSCDKNVSESGTNGINFPESSCKKRSSISTERTLIDNVEMKRARNGAFLSSESDEIPDLDSKSMENNDKGSFGCNISHISHFSDLAEKSMEQFMSVISSFNYTSSGSRASGLRAPLKDVRNTLAARSNISLKDIDDFAYVPKNKKIARVSPQTKFEHHS